MPIEKIFHVNIVVRDLDRSLPFYRDILGMRIAEPIFIGEGPPMGGIGLGAEAYGFRSERDVKVRGVFLRFGNDETEAFIDLLEFIQPRSIGGPYSTLHNIGIARIALKVSDIDQSYKELLSKGVKFITPPVRVLIGENYLADIRYCCFYDPDGTILELYGPGGSSSRSGGGRASGPKAKSKR